MVQWSSSPVIGLGKFAIPVLNILIATYTFTTGLHVDQVSILFLVLMLDVSITAIFMFLGCYILQTHPLCMPRAQLYVQTLK